MLVAASIIWGLAHGAGNRALDDLSFAGESDRDTPLVLLASGEPIPFRGTDARIHIDGGAYSSFGLVTTYYSGQLLTAPYAMPAYRFDSTRVFTNKPCCGPKRGHGSVQPRFAFDHSYWYANGEPSVFVPVDESVNGVGDQAHLSSAS